MEDIRDKIMDNQIDERVKIDLREGYDLILSPNLDLSEKVAELTCIFKNGIPDSWIPYNPTSHNVVLYIDKVENPNYLLKVKKMANPENWRTKKDLYLQSSRMKKFFIGMNSVINEFNMVKIVRELLKTEAAQSIAIDNGFTDRKSTRLNSSHQ